MANNNSSFSSFPKSFSKKFISTIYLGVFRMG
ncbi:hypothetical protein M2142_002530, partial [Fusobacterium sp. PH5-29]